MNRKLAVAILSVLLALLMCAANAEATESVRVPKTGADMKNAAECLPYVRYYDGGSGSNYANRNKSVWYFDATESGMYYFHLNGSNQKDDKALTLGVTLYDANGIKLQSGKASNGIAMSAELAAGDRYYLAVEILQSGTWYVRFTICSEGNHPEGYMSDFAVRAPMNGDFGFNIKKCKLCGLYEVELNHLSDHVADAPKVISNATCVQKEVVAVYCSICGEVMDEYETQYGSHRFGEMQTVKAATCVNAGYEEQRCLDCHALLSSQEIPALGHMVLEVIETPSTCITKGSRLQICSVCGEIVSSEEFALSEHVPGKMEIVKAATCVDDGLNEQCCTVCDLLLDSEIVKAMGHVNGAVEHTEATCMHEGSDIVICTVCGSELSNETLPIVDHVPAPFISIRSATCNETGMSEQHCSVCNVTLATEKTDALGHAEGDWRETKAATCTAEGERTLYCAVCNAALKTEAIPALGHSPMDWQDARSAACLQSGLREKKCSACGLTLETEQINALGHTYTEWQILTEATKEHEGERRRHCINCGDTKYEVIPKIEKILGIF